MIASLHLTWTDLTMSTIDIPTAFWFSEHHTPPNILCPTTSIEQLVSRFTVKSPANIRNVVELNKVEMMVLRGSPCLIAHLAE
jgi:hypothetical protein